MPAQDNLLLVAEENGMRRRGLVIDIQSIDADILIEDCLFEGTVANFVSSEPSLPASEDSANNFGQMFNSASSYDKA